RGHRRGRTAGDRDGAPRRPRRARRLDRRRRRALRGRSLHDRPRQPRRPRLPREPEGCLLSRARAPRPEEGRRRAPHHAPLPARRLRGGVAHLHGAPRGGDPRDAAAVSALDRATALELYRVMRTIRQFEARAVQLFGENKIWGTIHSYAGQEGVAVGVCAHLRDDDWITSTHRGHGHCIAKGADVGRMFAELLGRETGYCRGRGGSMHIADTSKGNLGANGIVGGGIPIATGAALTATYTGSDRVAVSFFGDGGARARAGLGPTFIVAETYRYEGHYYGDPQVYRTKDEIEDWRAKRDPLVIARTWLTTDRLASEADLARVDREVDAEIEKGVAF